MKGFNFLVGSILLSLLIPSAFALTCPAEDIASLAIKRNNPLTIQDNKLTWITPDPQVRFKKAYFQKADSVSKASLTCMYKRDGNNDFILKLSDKDAAKVDPKFDSVNWDNFYDPSLYSCDGKQVSKVGDCKFKLKTK